VESAAPSRPPGEPDVRAEEEFVRTALGKDLDTGVAELWNVYRGLVFSAALRLCGAWADAEDLTAETFLRAYRALSGYHPDRIATLETRPWLMTILMNLWRNRLRTTARKPPPAQLDETVEIPDPREGVEESALRRETGDELARALAHLPADQRAAVVLRHVVDLPVGEIAIALGIPQGTVKSHVSRGLKRLRVLTASEGGAP
jgi:RNA polymerase sigma factor (sigma-70 family)